MRIFRQLARAKKKLAYKSTTAKLPQHNDFYVVEFPKSGITWLSALLANMALIESGRREVASFNSAHLYVPDIHISRTIGAVAYASPPVRFIKSHARFNGNYIFVIYLVRHPLDVMKSSYRFNRESHGDIFGSFSDFCKSKKHGVTAWKSHVDSWLVGRVLAQRLHLVRYEDLLENAVQELKSISDNFGWNISDATLERSVDLSSMMSMKKNETLARARNPRYSMTFIGGLNDFEVRADTVEFVQDACTSQLRMLGYME